MTSAVVHTQITKETGVQAPKSGLNTVTEITKTVPWTQTTKEDAVKATEAEINSVKKLTSIDGGYVQAVSKEKDREFVNKAAVALSTKGPVVSERSQVNTVGRVEVVVEAIQVDNNAKLSSTSPVVSAVNTEESVKEKAVCHPLNTAENIVTTHASPTETNDKSVEGSDAVSHVSTTEQSLLTANTSNSENNAEAIKPAGSDSPRTEVSMSTSHVHKSEQSRDEISSEVTLVDQREGEKVKKEEEQKQGKMGKDKTEVRDEEIEKEGKTREGGKPEIKTAKVITRLAPDKQTPKKGSVQAPKPEIYIVTEITNTDHDTSAIEEAVCQATKEKINVTGMTSAVVHTQITKEAGVQASKTGLNTVTDITKTVPGTQITKEEAVKATKAEINGKSVEGSDVSHSSTTEQSLLTANISNTENTAEAIKSAGQILTLEEDEKQAKKRREHEGDKTEMRKEEGTSLISKLEQGLLLGDTFSSKQNTEVLEGAEVGSSIPLNDVETVKPAGQGTSLSPTEAERGVSLTDSGIALTSADQESPGEADVFLTETKPVTCLSPTDLGICLSPVAGEVFLDPANQELCPVDLEECVSPRNTEMYLSPNDSELSQSPVEAEFFLSPNDEEECMNLTEANECVKTVEKYILSTKEESQSLSSGRDQTSSEKHRTAKVTSPVQNENNLGFELVGDLAGRRDDLSSAKTGLTLGSHVQVRSTLGDSLYRSSLEAQEAVASMVGRTSVGDKKEVTRPGARHKDTSSVDSKGIFSPGGRFRKLSHGDKEDTTISSMGRSAWGPSALNGGTELKNSSWLVASTAPNSDGVFGKSASSGRVPAPGGTSVLAQNAAGKINGMDHSRGISLGGIANSASMVSGTATSLGAVTAHSTGTVNGIYGSRTGYSLLGISRLASAETGGDTVSGSVVRNQETSSDRAGRISRIGGSGEWKVYSGGTGRASSAGSTSGDGRVTSPPLVYHRSSSTGSGGQLNSGGSGGRLSTSLGGSGRLSSCAKRSMSVGSGGRLSSSGSGSVPSSTAANNRASSSGRYGSTGSGEWKPVYGGASGRRSSVGSGGRPGGTSRTPSPGGRLTITGGSGGWLNSTTVSSNRISSAGSGSKLSGAGSNDRLSSQAGGRISSSSGSGRTNSTGGRVITSSDGPIRSTGSGVGANKERISVCKMAALSMSAAGMERSKERQRQAKKSQQEQAAANRPHVQRWLTSGVGAAGNDLDGLDDIIRL
ncbi:uncharacterized protein LOC115363829 [Myripristis murdjan]|uniref:uncharacterized protein LOC115363829 n=1 Tax=Myripristis murdjan TaxID=586833 RepID=UPI001175D95C|nr:uncharacterized protein LOC115363829 [Myripristis murdjan]